MKLKLIIFGTIGVVFFICGVFILNESLKYPIGWGLLITGLIIVWLVQKQERRENPMKKKMEPLFKLEEPKIPEEEVLSADEKIEKFGTDIKSMSEEFAKGREEELKRLKREYIEMNKLKAEIEKNVLKEHRQYNQLKQDMAIVENMAKQKGALIEHKK